ncbi:hypothetical protein BE20_00940 [Sorangium cellulosum]|nr:hypothetical protein BE20_00940 [Sorangium cellulosum]
MPPRGLAASDRAARRAHVIVEEAPAPAASAAAAVEPAPRAPGALPFVLSAKSDAALRGQAAKLYAHLAAAPDVPLVDLAFSLATTRAQLDHRAALVAHDRATLLSALDALAHGRSTPSAALGRGALGGKLAVLFTGQGSQRAEMGRGLYAAFPAFRDAFDAACSHLDRALERPVRDVVFAPRETELARLLDETLYTQTALFAVEVALFRLLEAWGITPHALLGHSVGELVAAHVAGVLSLEDACARRRARAPHARPAGARRRDGHRARVRGRSARRDRRGPGRRRDRRDQRAGVRRPLGRRPRGARRDGALRGARAQDEATRSTRTTWIRCSTRSAASPKGSASTRRAFRSSRT